MAGTEPLRADDALWNELALGPNTRSFLQRVYAGGLDQYVRRLRTLGFAGGERGLDAGCGGGQWTLALAGMCREVWGIDVEKDRLAACERIATRMGRSNAHFKLGGLEQIPFEAASFDRVLCYSVLYQTNYKKAISELARVTRAGGLLYVSTNDVGRFVQHLFSPSNTAADFNPRSYAWKTLCNSMTGKREGFSMQAGGVVTPRGNVLRLLREAAFDVVESGPEGRLVGGTEVFMSGSYWGLTATYDVLARRRA